MLLPVYYDKFGITIHHGSSPASHANEMDNIEVIFNSFLSQYDSVDIAESEFKKAIHEDAELRALYREWCSEVGSTEKNGFFDYCQDYLDSQDDVWNSLNEYDDDE